MKDFEIYISSTKYEKRFYLFTPLPIIILYRKFHISLFKTNEDVASILFVIRRHARSGRSHLFCKLRTE